jgi:hypothetical protein
MVNERQYYRFCLTHNKKWQFSGSLFDFLGVPAQKRQRRQADPLQSFTSTSAPLSHLQKDFRLHPSLGYSKSLKLKLRI